MRERATTQLFQNEQYLDITTARGAREDSVVIGELEHVTQTITSEKADFEAAKVS